MSVLYCCEFMFHYISVRSMRKDVFDNLVALQVQFVC